MKTLQYFAASTMAPLFEVFDVYSKGDHTCREFLLEDLNSITPEQLEWFDTHSDLTFHVEEHDRELSRRLYCFVELVSKEIDKLRVKCLTVGTDTIPAPYGCAALEGLELDKNYLTNVNNLKYFRGGFSRNGEVFVLLPSNDRTNSSYWLLQELAGIQNRDLIKIRLDPLIHQKESEFNTMQFRMQVYGKGFQWERIKNLKDIEHTQFIPDRPDLGDILRTDLTWVPIDDEIHFTCEEMPKMECLEFRGSRYFHAIFERQSGLLKHCDGAIRFYTKNEFESRMNGHVRTNENTRIGKRVKVFQVDVPNNLLDQNLVTHKIFVNIAASFFVWNDDFLSYFNTVGG